MCCIIKMSRVILLKVTGYPELDFFVELAASFVGYFEQCYRKKQLKPELPEIRGSDDILCCMTKKPILQKD